MIHKDTKRMVLRQDLIWFVSGTNSIRHNRIKGLSFLYENGQEELMAKDP
jgi:hypothetical protein